MYGIVWLRRVSGVFMDTFKELKRASSMKIANVEVLIVLELTGVPP